MHVQENDQAREHLGIRTINFFFMITNGDIVKIEHSYTNLFIYLVIIILCCYYIILGNVCIFILHKPFVTFKIFCVRKGLLL